MFLFIRLLLSIQVPKMLTEPKKGEDSSVNRARPSGKDKPRDLKRYHASSGEQTCSKSKRTKTAGKESELIEKMLWSRKNLI
jgi:hypothetical protein